VTKMSWIKNQFNKLFKMDVNEEYEDERTYYYEDEVEQSNQKKPRSEGPEVVHYNQGTKSQSFRFPLIEDDVYEQSEPKVQSSNPVVRQDYYKEDNAPLKLPEHLQKQETNVSYDGEVSGIRELLERRRKGRGYSNVIRSSDDLSRKVVVTKEEREILTSSPKRVEQKINKEFINPLENRKRFVPTEVPSPVHGFLKPTPIEQLMGKQSEEVAASTPEQLQGDIKELTNQNETINREVTWIPEEREKEEISTEPMLTTIEQVEEVQPIVEMEEQHQEFQESDSVDKQQEEPALKKSIIFEAEVTEVENEVITDPRQYENVDAPPILIENDMKQLNKNNVEEEDSSVNEMLNEVQVQHVTIENSTIHIGQLNVEQYPQNESEVESEEPTFTTHLQRENRGSRVPFNVVMLKSDKEKLLTKQFVKDQIQRAYSTEGEPVESPLEATNIQVEIDEKTSIQLPEIASTELDEEQQTNLFVDKPSINVEVNDQKNERQESVLIEGLDLETAVDEQEHHTTVNQPIATQHVEEDLATYNDVLRYQELTEDQLEELEELEEESILQVVLSELADKKMEYEENQHEIVQIEKLNLIEDIEQEEEVTYKELQTSYNEYETVQVDDEQGQEDVQNEQEVVDTPDNQIIEIEEVQDEIEVQPVKKRIPYVKPPLEYLVPPEEMIEDRDWMDEQGENLVETLSYFQIQAHIESIVQGPAVTQFEITVGQGTKVSKVRNLADDIKLALAAKDIRIDAPIPGKRSIGIEIPNRISRSVRLSEVTDSESFRNSDSPLEAALGLDLTGKPVTIDLRKMPHGLIAGATGSGKSVCINSILVSLLYKADPNELKLMLIDPKMVELAPFNHIPHLVSPVITDVKAATAALKWAVEEMERRYQLFMHSGARKIEAYNKMCDENGMYAQKLPYLLIVIDELADLMMMSPQDVEDSICRITQKARAAGIHLIVATQRPSVDVITGLIKSNIPTRIAFSVSSQIDSRTILDAQGAERLLGRGDMLYLGNGMSAPTRIQGTFVTDDEIEEIIEFVREQGEPEYIFKQEELLKRTEAAEDQDELFEEVCRFVYEQGSASTSLLQRRYHIGYNRAARLIDMLERQGYVSEPKGSKARDVFITEEDLAVQFGD
jgi:DNA segregation ATPase FtsK/SpoIIIE, S-DNA-T family